MESLRGMNKGEFNTVQSNDCSYLSETDGALIFFERIANFY